MLGRTEMLPRKLMKLGGISPTTSVTGQSRLALPLHRCLSHNSAYYPTTQEQATGCHAKFRLGIISKSIFDPHSLTGGIYLRQVRNFRLTQTFFNNNESQKMKQLPLDEMCHKRIKINACGNLYAELSQTMPSLYKYAPKNRGIDFELDYYDSIDLLDAEARLVSPTVVLLHGSPGSYMDFERIIQYLAKNKIRVLAPNFPDYSATYKYSFRHSPRERLDYLLQFFKIVGIKECDMLIGHSSAIYTMFELLNTSLQSDSSEQFIIRSLGLFSTPTYRLPKTMEVTPIRLLFLKLFDYPLLRPLILAVINIFVKLQGIGNRVDKNRIEDLLIAASAVGYSNSDNMEERIKLIAQFQVPTFVIFGTNDRLIPERCFEQLKRDLGVKSDEEVKRYSADGKVAKDVVVANKIVHVSQFASAGHYAFQRYADQVNQDIMQFLLSRVINSKGLNLDNDTKLKQ